MLSVLMVVSRDLEPYKSHFHPWPLLFSHCEETWTTHVGVQRSPDTSSGLTIHMICRCPVNICTHPVKIQSTKPTFLRENWWLKVKKYPQIHCPVHSGPLPARAPNHHQTRTRSLLQLLCSTFPERFLAFLRLHKTQNPCCSSPPTIADNELD